MGKLHVRWSKYTINAINKGSRLDFHIQSWTADKVVNGSAVPGADQQTRGSHDA